MKKNVTFIFIAVLILYLFPQNTYAFSLSSDGLKVIYENNDDRDNWETFYLPHAKHAKIIHINATDLYVAKLAKDDETIINKIENATLRQRQKMFVQWEKDNEYLSEEEEKSRLITPSLRCELLAEIDKEEEETKNFWWKIGKASTKVLSFGATLGISKWVTKDWGTAGKYATFAVLTFTTILEAAEAACTWSWRKSKKEDKIKLPPLQDLPEIPANRKRVDLHSL